MIYVRTRSGHSVKAGTQLSSTMATGRQAAIGEASAAGRPANPIMNGIRRPWMGLRSLIAELAAFPVRVKRNDDDLVVTADLPGLKKDEVTVELSDGLLCIQAEPNRDGEPFFRRAGRRIFSLPDDAEIDKAKAQMKNGVLSVSMPVSHSRRTHTVSVEEDREIDLPPTGD